MLPEVWACTVWTVSHYRILMLLSVCKCINICYMAQSLSSLSAVNTHKDKMLSSVADFTNSPPKIAQPHLSSHELRVEREFSQVENCSCLFYQWRVPYFLMKYYSRQEILPREQENNWMGINDLHVHICYNTNTGAGNWEQALMASLMLPQITPWSSTMYGSGKRYKIMSHWE